jgi:hypothetical protein
MIGKSPLFVARQHGHSLVTMWRTYAAWMDGALESDISVIRAAIEGSAPELVPSPVQRDSAAQVGLTLAERLSNTESRLPRAGAPVAEFGTRFVTRCGTLATQVSEEKEKLSGGEGGIRTHVPELPDHPISSRRRYDHFGTSPVNLKFCRIYLSFDGVNLSIVAV